MPMREFGCTKCGLETEIYHPSIDPTKVPVPGCTKCKTPMSMLYSVPRIDTSSTFHPFTYKGPTGMVHEITNLHELRQVEHAYTKTGHNVRFDAYSADPSNPDSVDGYGQEYWDGTPTYTTGKITSLPTMEK